MSLFNEQYLNHGDLSYANIIFNRGTPYIIDFDETLMIKILIVKKCYLL